MKKYWKIDNLIFHFKTCKYLAKSYILTSTLVVDRLNRQEKVTYAT